MTAGGVDTDELSAKTMESRKVPGLYFIGEVVDVTGHLGGYNFQWAWASGRPREEHCSRVLLSNLGHWPASVDKEESAIDDSHSH